jgi:hypothetical protein
MHCSMIFYNFYSIDVVLVLLFYQLSINVFLVAFGLKKSLKTMFICTNRNIVLLPYIIHVISQKRI